jgi:hypothetical protein
MDWQAAEEEGLPKASLNCYLFSTLAFSIGFGLLLLDFIIFGFYLSVWLPMVFISLAMVQVPLCTFMNGFSYIFLLYYEFFNLVDFLFWQGFSYLGSHFLMWEGCKESVFSSHCYFVYTLLP